MSIPAVPNPTAPAALSTPSMTWVRDTVRHEASIMLNGKEYLIESRLGVLARRLGLTTAEDVVQAARKGDRAVRTAVVDALTTNETSWFRDDGPFHELRQTILPDLIRARAAERSLRIWSAACSSGQEAYSLAMICRDVVPNGWSVEILGTDVSRTVLERARSGRYSQLEVNRGLPVSLLVKWMRRAGTEWEIAPEIRSMIRWDWANLANPFPAVGRFDVILLRNVLIYFDTPTKTSVLERMRPVLRPGGYMLLGGSETTLGLGDVWRREMVGATPVWRLGDAPAPRPVSAVPTPRRSAPLAPATSRVDRAVANAPALDAPRSRTLPARRPDGGT